MIKKKSKKIKIVGKSGEVYYFTSFEDSLAKELKSKSFREKYYKEVARLDLAQQIHDLRKAKKMTQKAMALKADMPQSVIARLESGTHSISVDTLSRIAQALGKKIQLV
jgi:ribosome-binding protein aMBF1 (putative translation factor)